MALKVRYFVLLLWSALAMTSHVSFAVSAKLDAQIHYLEDGTISWEQPRAKRLPRYNGRCGETAAANIISMISHELSTEHISTEMRDLTPGTLPGTLVRFLNAKGPASWKYAYTRREHATQWITYMLRSGQYKAANGRSPFAALLRFETTKLHWVTVVNYIASTDQVVVNDNGTQSHFAREEFLNYWGLGEGTLEGSAIRASCCQGYSFVFQPAS